MTFKSHERKYKENVTPFCFHTLKVKVKDNEQM